MLIIFQTGSHHTNSISVIPLLYFINFLFFSSLDTIKRFYYDEEAFICTE
jgi:hypothetical protein